MCQVITGQETGVWKKQREMRWPQWLSRSADIAWTCKLNSEEWRWLTLQLELLPLYHRAFVWEVICDQILQVGRTARLRRGGGQDVCNRFLFLLKKQILLTNIFSRGIHKQPREWRWKEQPSIKQLFCVTTAGGAKLTFLFFLGFSDSWSLVSVCWEIRQFWLIKHNLNNESFRQNLRVHTSSI